jgi:uncharacterized protein (TIGR01777 family)
MALAGDLASGINDVVVLTRSAESYRGPGRPVRWDGRHSGEWARELEGAAAIVNLAGRNVNTRWTPAARRELVASRVESAAAVAEAIRECRRPPEVWINAGAVGIYGDRGDEVLTEQSATALERSDFLADLCQAWEKAVRSAELPAGVRKVILRFGVVFSREGGALPLMARITRLFAGGRLGSGRQWMPWIHIDDAVRAMRFVMESHGVGETVNVTGPNPVTNADLMRALRRALRRPPAPPAPAWAARLGGKLLGLPMEPALSSQRVVPQRLLEASFEFQHPELEETLATLLE